MDQLLILALDASSFILAIILVAMGLVIIFGLMNVINMAHGEFFLLGAYTVVMVNSAGGGFWLGFLLAPVFVGFVGLVLEELVIRHVYHRFLDTILATWGLSIFIKQAVVLTFGPAAMTVGDPIRYQRGDRRQDLSGLSPVHHGRFPGGDRLHLLAVLPNAFGLTARGVIANRNMAACLGVNTRRLDRMTFAYRRGAGRAGGRSDGADHERRPADGAGLPGAGLPGDPGGRGRASGRRPGGAPRSIGGADTVAANLVVAGGGADRGVLDGDRGDPAVPPRRRRRVA